MVCHKETSTNNIDGNFMTTSSGIGREGRMELKCVDSRYNGGVRTNLLYNKGMEIQQWRRPARSFRMKGAKHVVPKIGRTGIQT